MSAAELLPHDRNDFKQLAAELSASTEAEVRFDAGSRALYATDASNYRQVPIGVVLPRSVADVVTALAICRKHDVPLLPRGGGTSLAGQCCNEAVVVDTSKYLNRIVSIDPDSATAIVEPGCVLDDLRDAAERHHLTFGPDPSTHNHNTLGGMIGNNSCGVHSIMAGRTSDNVEALEILTYDGYRTWVSATSESELFELCRTPGQGGEIYRQLRALRDRYEERIRTGFPDIPRRVSGYNLPSLLPEHRTNVARALVGSEGTCVFVLHAKLRLVPSPPCRVLVVAGFPDVFAAADCVPRVLELGPIGLEGMDDELVSYMDKKHMAPGDRELLPAGHGWLLVEFGGETREQACERASRLVEMLKDERHVSAALFADSAQAHKLWKIRESGLGATSFVPGEPVTHPGWEDAAVPPHALGSYLREFRKLLDDFEYRGALYGHFGGGCVHVRISCDLGTAEGLQQWRRFIDRAADLVVEHGGSLSGEHGDGQARGALLEKMYGRELMNAMREFKSIWDPRGRMNPGKVVDPFPITQNLREGPDFHRPHLETAFAYTQDEGDLVRASRRCVGVGECRREWGAVMCPSYQATREEKHSTRGRARLLFETLRGMSNDDTPLRGQGWRSEALRDALELCLACKGCKSDCPVNVDMATYKAEFMHHYYENRMRPRLAYGMGLIYWWSRVAHHSAPLINAVTHAPGLDRMVKALLGISQRRSIPSFSARPFTRTYSRAAPTAAADVCLWPDTFTNSFRPQSLHAAAAVLERLGLRVALPQSIACCARPLYAEGMLDTARKQLQRTMQALEPAIARGLPIIGLEPSCVASFRDEIVELFPSDKRAVYLSNNVLMLSELIERRSFELPRLDAHAMVHLHCNHRAVMGVDAELAVIRRLFASHELPEPGCCGMAGPFGFDAHKYDVSMKIAEQALLPAARSAARHTWVIANGFSCREQLVQGAARESAHLAEAIWYAMNKE